MVSAGWTIGGQPVTEWQDFIDAFLDVAFGDGLVYVVARDGREVVHIISAPPSETP